MTAGRDEPTGQRRRPVGLGHLTLLDVAPPDLVVLAGRAGFEAVGLRAAVASPTEEPWPMAVGSPMLRETLRRMDDTGVRVADVEIIRLSPETRAADLRGLFETGAELGARFVNVIDFDPDHRRAADTIAAIAEEAAPFGLRPCIEPMVYSGLKSLADAVTVIDGSAAGIIVDPLHLQRCGDTPADLRRLDPRLLGYFQLCDGMLTEPSGLPRHHRLPRGQPADVDDAQLEARVARMLPGEGELPLREIIAAVPPDLTVAIEAPNLQLSARLGIPAFLRRARDAAARLLDAPSREPGPPGPPDSSDRQEARQ
ncbi:MAG TPA: TIM barrel protein [Pseudonocardiaceae bacterium]|jgi:sugar phosphate isomerase/epimerase